MEAGGGGAGVGCRAMVTCLTCQSDPFQPCTYFLLPAAFTVLVFGILLVPIVTKPNYFIEDRVFF